MVEGIVVISTMLVFLGMNIWAAHAYGGKIDQANASRRDALYFASHACQGGGPTDVDTYTQGSVGGTAANGGGSESGGEEGDPAGQNVASAIDARDPNMGVGSSISRSWNTAEVSRSGSVSGTALVGQDSAQNPSILVEKKNFTKNLATTSYTLCNEKVYESGWRSLLDFGWEFLRTAGGVPG
jgi:hypothetical protein